MNWLAFSVIALIGFSSYELLSRYLGVKSRDPQVFSGIYNLIAVLLVPFLLLIIPFKISHIPPMVIALTIIAAFIYGMFGRYEYLAHKHVEASTLSIIIKLATVLSVLVSFFVLHESLTVAKVLGFIIILAANFLVLGMPTKAMFTKEKGLIYAYILTLFLGIAWIFDKTLSPFYGIVFYSVIGFLAPAISCLLFPPAPINKIKQEFRLGSWKIVLLAFVNVVSYALYLKALSMGDASNVIPIATSTSPVVILLAALFLGERKALPKKIFAGVLIVIAIYLMR